MRPYERRKLYHWILYCLFLGFGVFLALWLLQEWIVDSFSVPP